MQKYVLIGLLVLHQHRCEFVYYGDDFAVSDYQLNDTANCRPLNTEQYYLYNVDQNSSVFQKLDCLSESLINEAIYFSKCCPPDYVYEQKHHKCVENNSTNIFEDFNDNVFLIRTDLSECKVVLDHILDDIADAFRIESDGSLFYENQKYRLGSYCIDNTNAKEKMVIRTCEEINVCRDKNIRCIKKCCPDGQYYEGNACSPGHQFGLSLRNITRFKDPSELFNAVVVSEPCLKYLDRPGINFRIEKDGTTVIHELGVWQQYTIEESYYCVEYVRKMHAYKMLLCRLQDPEILAKYMIYKVALISSCICLVITMLMYIILPDLKNFIGKIIICYCSCLLVGFILLTWVLFDPILGDYCTVFGFLIAFSFLAAFSWMTILSYEMWRVLGSMTAEYGNKLHTHKKRFFWYNIVGWSIPLMLMAFSVFDYIFYFLPDSIHITVGYSQCVFENNIRRGMYGFTLHFALPSGLYILINLIIFMKTIRYIYHVKHEINCIKTIDHIEKRKKWTIFHTDKERLKMVTRIFLVMGVNFLFETISSLLNFRKNSTLEIIEIIFDTFNGLQGVFILFIFLAKKKTWISFKQFVKLTAGSRKSSIVTTSTEVMTSLQKSQS